MPRKPDFSTQATIHKYYTPSTSTSQGYWSTIIIETVDDVLRFSEIAKQIEAKEQRKRDRGVK